MVPTLVDEVLQEVKCRQSLTWQPKEGGPNAKLLLETFVAENNMTLKAGLARFESGAIHAQKFLEVFALDIFVFGSFCLEIIILEVFVLEVFTCYP